MICQSSSEIVRAYHRLPLIEVPRTLSPRAEELLRELAAEEQAAVSPKRSSFFSRFAEYFQAKESSPETEEKA